MKIYDISQEVFSSAVYEGDPKPKSEAVLRMSEGGLYNLSAFCMCAHNGTHIDAPFHFIESGDTVENLELEKLVGYAYLAHHDGDFTAEDATRVIKKAKESGLGAEKRILISGDACVRIDAARVFSSEGIFLIGNESQTVGPADAPMEVHLELLSHGIALLEGVRLSGICEGVYFLSAAPLKLAGLDGSPVRALLIEFGEEK